MLAAGVGLLRACPAVRRAGVVPATAWSRRCPTQSFLSQPVSSLSSMPTASRGSGDESDGGGRRAGPGGGGMVRQPLPVRTVPDDIIGFSCRTYMAGDSDDRYPNVHGVHPAEFKVELTVPVPLLGLSEKEEERLIQLVGPRYRERDQELRLVSDRFPNRIDNKRYLVFLLENILVEARNLDGDDAGEE